MIGLVGVMVLLGLAYLLSVDRKKINLRVVGSALLLQAAIAIFVLAVPFGKGILQGMTNGFNKIISYVDDFIETVG